MALTTVLVTTSWVKIANSGDAAMIENLTRSKVVYLQTSSGAPSGGPAGLTLQEDTVGANGRINISLTQDLYAIVSDGTAQVSVDKNITGGTGSTTVTGSVLIGAAGTAGDTTVTLGGTAQNLFSGTTPTNGFEVSNPDATEDLWVSDSGAAVINGQGSWRLGPNGGTYTTPGGYKPVGAVSVLGATTAHKITARRW